MTVNLATLLSHLQELTDYLARTHGISRGEILVHMKAWEIEHRHKHEEFGGALRQLIETQEGEQTVILKAVNEDQQMPNLSQTVAMRSSYWISGYVQALKEVVGDAEASP